MKTHDVVLEQLATRPTAVVHGHVTEAEIPDFLSGTFAEVMQALGQQGLAPAGPPFGCYVRRDDGFDVEAGFPTTRAVTPAGRVEAGELPGGPTAQVLHEGDYSTVAAAYQAVTEWVTAHGYTATAPPWESYLDGPEVAEPRTVICLPCR